MPDSRLRLITRGDDAGSCSSANRAVVEAARKGILRNISVMVPGPAFAEAAELLAGLPGVALGLHVTLNAEWDRVKWGPVLPPERVPSLVDAIGHFWRTPNILLERGFKVEEALAETQAQIDRARAHGLPLAYLDEHMGVGWLPGLRDGLNRLAEREGLIIAGKFAYLPSAGSDAPDALSDLLARLKAAPPGDYVYVTHPGYDAEDMRQFDHEGLQPGQIAREREADRRLWSDPALLALCESGAFEAIRYSDAG